MKRNIPSKRKRIEARSSESWIRKGIIYEVFPRSFTRSGNIDGIIDKLPYLKKLGISIVWIMPIHPIGSIKRKRRLGSPYSVKDYYQINEGLGDITKFKQLVKLCHKNRLRIIIDLVIGHSAWDNTLFIQRPEWYKKTKGKFLSPVPEWTDVVAFNYSNNALVRYMVALMKYWIEIIRVDGFRCDDAGRIPIRFWELARDSFNQNRNILMLAESDNIPLHHRKAFDLSYGTNFYLVLKNVIKGKVPASRLHTIITKEQSTYAKGSLLLRFTSNHDTNNQDGSDITLLGLKGSKLAAVVNNTIPGVPMLYNGQESGNKKKLDLFEAVKIPKGSKKDLFILYRRLFFLRKQYPTIVDGQYVHISTSDDDHCFAFCRALNNEYILIAANFVKKAKLLVLTLPADMMIDLNSIRSTNLLTGHRVFINIFNGKSFTLTLPSFGYVIISITQE